MTKIIFKNIKNPALPVSLNMRAQKGISILERINGKTYKVEKYKNQDYDKGLFNVSFERLRQLKNEGVNVPDFEYYKINSQDLKLRMFPVSSISIFELGSFERIIPEKVNEISGILSFNESDIGKVVLVISKKERINLV